MKTKVARKGKNLALGLISLFVFSMMTASSAAFAQQQLVEEPITTVYEDVTNGFRVQVPADWVAIDTSPKVDPEHTEEEAEEAEEIRQTVQEVVGFGYDNMAVLCPEVAAEREIGGGYSGCSFEGGAAMNIAISKYHFHIAAMEEFAAVIDSGENVTTDDLLTFDMQQNRDRYDYSNIRITNETDTTTNLIDPLTNETISTSVPVKMVEYVYDSEFTLFGTTEEFTDRVKTLMFVVHNDHDNDDGNPETGEGVTVSAFSITVVMGTSATDITETPPGTIPNMPEVRQVFDSFELLVPGAVAVEEEQQQGARR